MSYTVVDTAWTVTVPGAGIILIEPGRVFDVAGPPVLIAGPHLPPSEAIATHCEALRQRRGAPDPTQRADATMIGAGAWRST